mgnify:CR=1 FL=1
MKKIPMRMCLACRVMQPKNTLIRVVKTPEGEIKIDEKGKMNGRGAYVCKNPDCLAKIIKNRALAKQLEAQVPAEIYDKLKEIILYESK